MRGPPTSKYGTPICPALDLFSLSMESAQQCHILSSVTQILNLNALIKSNRLCYVCIGNLKIYIKTTTHIENKAMHAI